MENEVLSRILPARVTEGLKALSADKLTEIRLRSNRSVTVQYGGVFRYLSPGGLLSMPQQAVTVTQSDVEQTVLRACEKSLYAVNDRICAGFLTLSSGIRLGIAGETVFDGDKIRAVKNFAALNIRIPHEVKGCAATVLPMLKSGNTYHTTLVLSPPGAGKTTILRDIARQIGDAFPVRNVLIADERSELAASTFGTASLDVGQNTDVITGCTKAFAFERAIRSLRPDVMITDELTCEDDAFAVLGAAESGITVFASVHADSLDGMCKKPWIAPLIEAGAFTRYVLLSERHGVGTIEGVFNADFSLLAAGAP
ncbi:MAG: Flp pilus assembly complex ATPase component TadA [Clostridiales bacterium]|nr:Flp pilus assembly complex ATPase component TadA [Clostridiales bacterium]